MAFLLQPPPDTSGYMIAGYIIIFGVMLIYLISLIVRNRNLKQDLEVLSQLETEADRAQNSPADRESFSSAHPQPRS